MAPSFSNYDTLDEAALAIGLGLVLVGSVVMGFLETILGSPHTLEQTNEAGDVVAHTSFDPHLRAYIIALGFIVLLLWSLYRVGSNLGE
ncbi:MAG: hypothetical protein ABEI52_13195 [Halobacteriaceae archaeon]